MPVFRYTARDANAQIQDGTVDAVDLPAAKEVLRLMGMQPIELEIENTVTSETLPLKEVVTHTYIPFVDTARLYAGWLLAGYSIAYALGYYALTKPLPFEVPYVYAFVYSQIIFTFAFVCFLFLFATTLQKKIQKGMLSTALLTLCSVAIFIVYRVNV